MPQCQGPAILTPISRVRLIIPSEKVHNRPKTRTAQPRKLVGRQGQVVREMRNGHGHQAKHHGRPLFLARVVLAPAREVGLERGPVRVRDEPEDIVVVELYDEVEERAGDDAVERAGVWGGAVRAMRFVRDVCVVRVVRVWEALGE